MKKKNEVDRLGVEADKFTDSAYRNISAQPVLAYTLFTNNRNLFFILRWEALNCSLKIIDLKRRTTSI